MNRTPPSTSPSRPNQPLSAQLHAKFLHLASELSPENLSCDGELPRSEVERKQRALLKQWADLEREVGRKVTEDEIWHQEMAASRTRSGIR